MVRGSKKDCEKVARKLRENRKKAARKQKESCEAILYLIIYR